MVPHSTQCSDGAPECSEVVPVSTWSHPRQILSAQVLATLNQRSNVKGFVHLLGHLAILAVSGYLWATQPHWAIALPALVVYGFGIATMFAPLHECVHRTAFASQGLNDAVAWLAGLLSFYNSTFYRRYHKWHHRYTQIPGKDPELDDPKPTTLRAYLLELSGLPWWLGKLRGHSKIALGRVEDYPYLSQTGASEAIRSTRLQLAVYGGAIALSVAAGHPWAVWLYWVLPLAVGQPLLRFILLAEHTGCSQDNNPLTNTRTTFTLPPLRFLMWNMPYHTEHHLYPSIPFHALAEAHRQLRPNLAHVATGYLQVNRQIIANLRQPAV